VNGGVLALARQAVVEIDFQMITEIDAYHGKPGLGVESPEREALAAEAGQCRHPFLGDEVHGHGAAGRDFRRRRELTA
jgi:hypothetical protein